MPQKIFGPFYGTQAQNKNKNMHLGWEYSYGKQEIKLKPL